MDARFLHRFGLIVALAAAFAGMGASLLYCFPVTVSCEIDVASIRHSEGNAYVVSMSGHLPGGFANVLFEVEPDSPGSPSASRLRLLEDGVQFGVPHSIHADIAQKGQGRFSHWGSDILFSTPDSSSPIKSGRMYSMRYPVSPPWWLPLALLMGGIAGLSCIFNLSHVRAWQGSSAESTLFGVSEAVYSFAAAKRHYLFWGAVVLVGLYLNTVFILLLSAPVAAPDSSTYLIWSLFRTVGYSAFLYGYHLVFPTWEYLPLVQLNLLIAGVVCLSYAVVSVTRSYVIGWLVLALIVHAENMLLSAADMLTEAPFSAFIMMHVAFMYLLFKGNRTYFGLLAGLSLAAAILIKSVAVVFLGPLLLLLLFLPEWRRPVFLLVLCPAVVAWLAPSAYNLARYGFFESSIASGYALGGHVAAWIHPHAGSAFPGEAARIESRLEGVLAKRPAQFNTMDDYINYTANEYNGLLWGNIVPEMSAYYSNICPPDYSEYFQSCTWAGCKSQCMLQTNKVLLQLSREAIAANPRQYAYHVLVHTLGMWRRVFGERGDRDYAVGRDELLHGVNSRADKLSGAYNPQTNSYSVTLGPLPPFKPLAERTATVSRINDSTWKRWLDLVTLRDLSQKYLLDFMLRNGQGVLGVGLGACLFLFRLSRLSPAAKAFCYTGLCLNSYFLGTALAQPAGHRYAWTMQGLVVALLLLGLYIAAKSLISAGKFLISQIGAVSWEHYARKLFTRGENTR